MESNTWYYFHSTVSQTIAGILAIGATIVLFKLQQLQNEYNHENENIRVKDLADNKYRTWKSIDKMIEFDRLIRDNKWQELFKFIFESTDTQNRSLFAQPTVYGDIIEKIDTMAMKRIQQTHLINSTKSFSLFGLLAISTSIVFIASSDFLIKYGWLLLPASFILIGIFLYKTKIIMSYLIQSTIPKNVKYESEIYLDNLGDELIKNQIKSRNLVGRPQPYQAFPGISNV